MHFPSRSSIFYSSSSNSAYCIWFSSHKLWFVGCTWTWHHMWKAGRLGTCRYHSLKFRWHPCSLLQTRIWTTLYYKKTTKRHSSEALVHDDTSSDAFRNPFIFSGNCPGDGQYLCKLVEFQDMRCLSPYAYFVHCAHHPDCGCSNRLHNRAVREAWPSMVVEVCTSLIVFHY